MSDEFNDLIEFFEGLESKRGVDRAALDKVRKRIPGIVDIGVPGSSGSRFMVISINKTRPHEAQKLIRTMWGACGRRAEATAIIVVDGDVDVHSLQKVFWAWSVHVRPELDVMVSEVETPDSEESDALRPYPGARIGIDATTKMEAEGLKRPMPDRVVMDPDVVAKVDEHWETDGFPKVG